MTTAIVEVPGIGAKTADYLEQQGITTVTALLEAGMGILVVAPGFGEARARKVMDSAVRLLAEAGEGESSQAAGNKGKAAKRKGRKSKKGEKGKKSKKNKKREKKKEGKKEEKQQKSSAKRTSGTKKKRGNGGKKQKGKK